MKTKKILSMLVAMTMLLICFGITAIAEESATVVAKIGEHGYESVQAAINAAKVGDTVTIKEGTYSVPTMKAGITVVGEGNVLLEGTLSGTLENLTMKNLHIKGGNAQRWAYAKGSCVFENVTFEATSVYALHFDGITEDTNLLYKDCTIIGWAAMGGSPASCVFDGCTIKGNGAYGVIRTYFPTTIKNCTFDVANVNATDIYQDGIHAVDAKIEVENCTNANGNMKDILNVSGEACIYVDGNLALANVAKIGDTTYATLEAAFTAATEGQTITLLADTTPALTSQRAITKAAVIDLNGKTLTLTEDDLYFGTTTFKNGDIVVDPSVKASTAVFWMFANQTLTFDNVKLTATGVTGTYLIGLDGNNSDLNLLNGSEIIVNNTTALDLDIICVNASTGNDILIDNSKVNVTNLDGRVFFRGNYTVSGNSDIDLSGITKAGFRIEAGQTLKIEDTATVDIDGEPRDGGIHITDATAVYTVADTATVNTTVNAPAAPELPTATVTKLENEDLTFALNFKADDVTEKQLAYYGDWFADFELKINKDVTFNANGGANGYLSGQYDAWGENWVDVPFEDVTVNANEPLKIMECASKLMGQDGLKLTYNDVYGFVKDFNCGVFFEEEFLAANPALEVTLELRMYNPDESKNESHVIGETYTFKAPVVEEESPYIFGKAFYMVDLPEINGRYQVGLYAGIDSLKYKKVGFKIYDQNDKIIGEDSTNKVYSSVKGNNMTVTAKEIDSFRIFGTTVEFGKGWDNIAVFFRPYAIDFTGKEILGYKYKIADIYTATPVVE